MLVGAIMLSKFSVLGRPNNLDNSKVKADCACSRCGWGMFGHFFLSSIFCFSLSWRWLDKTEILSQRTV